MAVPARRSAQDRRAGAGDYEAHPNDSRAPLMARVSFVALKRIGIALLWVILFIAVCILLTLGLSRVVPDWGTGWEIPRTGIIEVIAFGLATFVVGKLLNKYSCDRLGGRAPAVTPLLPAVLLGDGQASTAVRLAVVLGVPRVAAACGASAVA